MNNFGKNLVKLRKEKGMTQEDLADIFQVSRQTVSKWETDTTFPETEKLILIAKYFNVSLDSFINSEKMSDVEQFRIENIMEKKTEDVNKNIIYYDEQYSKKNIKEDSSFDKRNKRGAYTVALITFFLILVIGIPMFLNNLSNKAYRMGDIIETAKKIELQVNSINYPGNIGGFEADSELTYVVIEIEMKNIDETAITITPEQFKYSNKMTKQFSNYGLMTFFDNTPFANEMFFKNHLDSLYGVLLEPNYSRKGYLVFASPRDARQKQKLIYTESFNTENKTIIYSIILPDVL